MTRAVRALLVGALFSVFVGASPAPAAPTSCAVTATGHPSAAGNCRYVATGPGVYAVRTLTGFRIMASADDGVSWRTVAAAVAQPNKPWTGVVVAEGQIDTRAGELVDVAIGITWQDLPDGKLRYQDGTLTAGSV